MVSKRKLKFLGERKDKKAGEGLFYIYILFYNKDVLCSFVLYVKCRTLLNPCVSMIIEHTFMLSVQKFDSFLIWEIISYRR